MPVARSCIRLGLFPIADRGSILSSTPGISCMCVSIVGVKCTRPFLLKAFGYSTDDLLRMYYPVEEIRVSKGEALSKLDPEIHHGLKCSTEVTEKGGKDPLVREGAKLTKALIAKLKAAGIKEIPVTPAELVGRAVLTELVDSGKKQSLAEKSTFDRGDPRKILESDIEESRLYLDTTNATLVILDTLDMERTGSKKKRRWLRSIVGFDRATPSVETARALFDNLS